MEELPTFEFTDRKDVGHKTAMVNVRRGRKPRTLSEKLAMEMKQRAHEQNALVVHNIEREKEEAKRERETSATHVTCVIEDEYEDIEIESKAVAKRFVPPPIEPEAVAPIIRPTAHPQKEYQFNDESSKPVKGGYFSRFLSKFKISCIS